jgi:DNA-binding winged helix-turn-helix (wHTH) protein
LAGIFDWAFMQSASRDAASAWTNHGARRIQFGRFEANLATGELHRSGLRVRLQSQPFKLLAILVERPGDLVSREELQRELWGDDTNVDFDHSLSMAVNKVREALGDSAENPRFIETLAKRGYRFIAPVTAIASDAVSAPGADRATARETAPAAIVDLPSTPASPPDSANAAFPTSKPKRNVWPWVAAGLAVICLVEGIVLLLR